MQGSMLLCPTNAPAGLKHGHGNIARFWVRPDAISFRRLFAVHFAPMPDGVHRTAYQVSGYLGSFRFDWSDPTHAKTLLLHQRISKHSRQLFGSLLDEGTGEWLLCNQQDSASASACDDADYVARRCMYDRAVKGNSGVYFISNGRNAVKIGQSGNCMNSRFISLQMANPEPLRVLAVIPDSRPSVLEQILHEILASKRIRGEWFAMSDDEAVLLAIENGGRKINEFPS